MVITKTRKWIFITAVIWVISLFSLGSWWMYLVYRMSDLLSENQISYKPNLEMMIRWEGLFFFTLLIIITLVIFYLLYLDLKKTKALQVFFASLTHELKTPLAKLKLKSEILKEMLEQKNYEGSLKHTEGILNASEDLELEFDKMLQLSRVNQVSNLSLNAINLKRFLEVTTEQYKKDIDFEIQSNLENEDVLVDQYSLKVILKNLIQNSIKHSLSNKIKIRLKNQSQYIELEYNDNGKAFTGDFKKLGKLFYKHNSNQGSGIGLYLISTLVQQMKGSFKILENSNKSLYFKINLLKENQ